MGTPPTINIGALSTRLIENSYFRTQVWEVPLDRERELWRASFNDRKGLDAI
jgi:hypothetical protein